MSEGCKKKKKSQDYYDLTCPLSLKEESDVELCALTIRRTTNHNEQKTLHETAGAKRVNRSKSGIFQKHSKCQILSIHPSCAYRPDILHMHCIIQVQMTSSISFLSNIDLL